jgi:mono/diheme cytochrome c family protein
MKKLFSIIILPLALTSMIWAAGNSAPSAPAAAAQKTTLEPADAEHLRVEGERRFQANCGRCHTAPQKFPPRMMATIVRHMRVRATITDEDMRSILYYMTQ